MRVIVRVAIVAVTIGLFVLSSMHAMLGHRDIAVLSALATPLGISAWGFARAGHDEPAIMLVSGVLLTVVTLILMLNPLGVHDVSIVAYGGIVLIAALLLSRRNFIAITVITVVAAATDFSLDMTGHTQSVVSRASEWSQLAVFVVLTSMFAVIARVASETLFGGLRDAQRAAAGDALTGLANRAGFEASARRVLKRAAAGGGTCALLLVHLEGFRRLRVMVGRDASDRMVAEAARRMVSVVGDELVGRVSDAEFAILARDLPEDGGAEAVAAKVRQALDFEFSGAAVRSTVGFSRFPRDADQLEALLLAAEASLLAEQPAGRT